MTKTVIVLCAAALMLAACEQPGQQPNITAEELMNLDREFSQYAVENGPYAAWDKYFAEDAVGLSQFQPPARGKDEIIKAFEDWPGNLTLSWEPFGGDVAKSGDLGYTWGRYAITGLTEDGTAINTEGKYVTIWQRQGDGEWKIVLDGGSTNAPPPEPVPDQAAEQPPE